MVWVSTRCRRDLVWNIHQLPAGSGRGPICSSRRVESLPTPEELTFLCAHQNPLPLDFLISVHVNRSRRNSSVFPANIRTLSSSRSTLINASLLRELKASVPCLLFSFIVVGKSSSDFEGRRLGSSRVPFRSSQPQTPSPATSLRMRAAWWDAHCSSS